MVWAFISPLRGSDAGQTVIGAMGNAGRIAATSKTHLAARLLRSPKKRSHHHGSYKEAVRHQYFGNKN